jgi:PAS domain S-box-containing protein
LGSSGNAIIAADSQAVIQLWNPGADRVFGFSAAEALGRLIGQGPPDVDAVVSGTFISSCYCCSPMNG